MIRGSEGDGVVAVESSALGGSPKVEPEAFTPTQYS